MTAEDVTPEMRREPAWARYYEAALAGVSIEVGSAADVDQIVKVAGYCADAAFAHYSNLLAPKPTIEALLEGNADQPAPAAPPPVASINLESFLRP